MRIEQLQQVLTIAATGSINRAARELFLSQSTLSQSLHSLEEEVGAPIFARRGGGVELTPFGCEFVSFAESTCSQLKLLREFSDSDAPPVCRFAAASQYLRFANALFIRLFERHRSELAHSSFLECSFPEIVEHVCSQRAELGIVFLSAKQRRFNLQLFRDKGLLYRPFAQYPVAVIVGEKNPCYDARGPVSARELAPYPLVMYANTYFDFSAELAELGFADAGNLITVSDRYSMHEIIRGTDAFSLAIYAGAYGEIEYYDRIRAIPVSGREQTMELGYIVNTSRPLSPIAEEYLAMVRQALGVPEA
jgi:DNA-binding transcriptional LysR family regulator